MRAIDTNVIVRFLTADDPEQSAAVRAVFAAGDIFVPLTVCLESEWVLRSAYDFAKEQIASALEGMAGLPGVTVEEPDILAQGLEWLREGLDFADALHLAKSSRCSALLTFDRRFVKAAAGISAVRVELP